MVKESIINLKKALSNSLQTVPNLIEVLKRGLDGVEIAAEEENTYSTEERVVGKWIDGSEIYEKVVNFGELPNATGKTVEHGITNLGKVIKLDIITDNNEYYIPAPGIVISTTPPDTIITALLTKTQIRIETNKNRSTYTAYVIIQYTKTAQNREVENNTKSDGNEENNDER